MPMEIIKLNATNSTNTYLKELLQRENVNDNTLIWTENQTHGRGQQSAKWISEPYKNLTFSFLKRFNNLPSTHHFVLNMVVVLSILRGLKKLQIPQLALKWPNDILSENKKICGILIENSLSQQQISTSIIGVGININQLIFNDLPNVSSLKKITGIHYNLEELLHLFIKEFSASFSNFEIENHQHIFEEYHTNLFRKDKPSTFQTPENEQFMGFIRGVNPQGELLIELEDAILKSFQPKEIQLLY